MAEQAQPGSLQPLWDISVGPEGLVVWRTRVGLLL